MSSRIYFAADDPLFDATLRLGGVGVREVMQPGLYRRPQGIDSWIIMHFHDDVTCLIDAQLQAVQAGSTILWCPRVPHSFGHPSRIWTHSWLMVSGDLIETLLRKNTLPANEVLTGDTGDVVLEELSAIFAELLDHLPPDLTIIQAHLMLVIQRLERASKESAPGSLPSVFRGLPRFIEQNLQRPLTLEELASQCALGVSRFSELFQVHFGLSPMRYVEKRRMDQAARLLQDRGMRVGEVAFQVGYADPLYFSRRFHKYHGQSPQRFRAGNEGKSENKGIMLQENPNLKYGIHRG